MILLHRNYFRFVLKEGFLYYISSNARKIYTEEGLETLEAQVMWGLPKVSVKFSALLKLIFSKYLQPIYHINS